MTSGTDKLGLMAVDEAIKRGVKVLDADADGLLDAGDTVVIPTFHRRIDGPRRDFVLPVAEDNQTEIARILTSPDGFFLQRFARRFGDSRGFIHYSYQFEKGRIGIDEVEGLVMSPTGVCQAIKIGADASAIEKCTPFELELFTPRAEDTVPFITEKLLVERHMASVAELLRLQGEIGWVNATEGREIDLLSTYRGYEFLFSSDAIGTVDLLVNDLKENGGDERRLKELTFYRSYLVSRWLGREAASFKDRVEDKMATTPVEIEWLGMTVSYAQLDQLIAEETVEVRLQELRQKRAAIQRDVFNPIFLERARHLDKAVRRFHASSLDYVRELRHIEDLGAMLTKAHAFFAKSDSLYQRLLEEEALRWEKKQFSELRFSDLPRIMSFDAFEKHFAPQTMTAFMRATTAAMGFELEPKDGRRITINDFAHPRRDPTPQCIFVDAPQDVRVTYRPVGGFADYETLFHEMGHALHLSNATAKEWAFRNLGDATAAETYASLAASLMTDPAFLERYREFVRGWNRQQIPSARVPELTAAQVGQIVRLGALRDLFMVRRYNVAKMTYETARMGAEGETLRKLGIDPATPVKKLYASLFERAWAVPMEEWEAERNYLLDSDDELYAADYARAFVLCPQLSRKLRSKFGERWFSDPVAGRWLREKLFSEGNALTPADLRNKFGLDPDDYTALEEDLRWRIRAAERLEKGTPLPPRP